MKKFLLMLISLFLVIEVLSGGGLVSAEEIKEDRLEVQEYIDSDTKERIRVVFYNDISLKYYVDQGIMVDYYTGELLCISGPETIVYPNESFIFPNERTTNYHGVSIDDRWIFSYNTVSSKTVYNATVDLIIAVFYAAVSNPGDFSHMVRDLLQDYALLILARSLYIHGNNSTTAYFDLRTRHYGNRYILSDFACLYEELDESGNFLGVSSYSNRLTRSYG